MQTGGIRVEAVCRILLQTLEGLQFLHSKGIVHRDLRSENIMIESMDPTMHIRIIDLGLSHVFSEALAAMNGALYKRHSMMHSTVTGDAALGPTQVGGCATSVELWRTCFRPYLTLPDHHHNHRRRRHHHRHRLHSLLFILKRVRGVCSGPPPRCVPAVTTAVE